MSLVSTERFAIFRLNHRYIDLVNEARVYIRIFFQIVSVLGTNPAHVLSLRLNSIKALHTHTTAQPDIAFFCYTPMDSSENLTVMSLNPHISLYLSPHDRVNRLFSKGEGTSTRRCLLFQKVISSLIGRWDVFRMTGIGVRGRDYVVVDGAGARTTADYD